MTRMECDFCGREIKYGENYYFCNQHEPMYISEDALPVRADICPECFRKAFKNAMKEREANDK